MWGKMAVVVSKSEGLLDVMLLSRLGPLKHSRYFIRASKYPLIVHNMT